MLTYHEIQEKMSARLTRFKFSLLNTPMQLKVSVHYSIQSVNREELNGCYASVMECPLPQYQQSINQSLNLHFTIHNSTAFMSQNNVITTCTVKKDASSIRI